MTDDDKTQVRLFDRRFCDPWCDHERFFIYDPEYNDTLAECHVPPVMPEVWDHE